MTLRTCARKQLTWDAVMIFFGVPSASAQQMNDLQQQLQQLKKYTVFYVGCLVLIRSVLLRNGLRSWQC